MMRWLWCSLLMGAFGCKESAPPGAAAAGSATRVATAASATPADGALAPDATVAADPRCADACLFLADIPVAQAKGAYEAACGAVWPYTDANCDGLLFARNCIYAAHGNVFKKPEWKDKFEKLPWYKPRADFKERDIPAVAMANIKDLKRTYEQCGLPEVSAEDIALIAKILEDVSQTNISVIEIDGAAKTSVSDRLRHHMIVGETWMSYAKKPGQDRRTIVVGGLYHAVGGGQLDEDLVVELTFDAANELRAIRIQR